MDFSLSSSLVGSAVSNPDKLALDLQFAVDKTLTARKGPTPVFVRGSGATFVDSDKLVKWAPENLYSFSQSFNDIFWTKTRVSVQADATIAPDGTLTADKLVEDTTPTSTHQISSGITPSAIPHRLSVFAKKAERNFIVLRLGGQNDFFNLNTGVAITNMNSPTITDVGNGWYRCSVVSSAGTQGSFTPSIDGITNSYTGDGTSGIFIWGAQLERSSTVRTYNPTTTGVFYGPRFDHDPVTGACKGLLMEETRTNSLIQSEDLTKSIWSRTGLTVTGNALTSPDGLVTSDLISEDLSGGVHAAQQTGYTLSASQPYTFSVFAKAAAHTSFQMSLSSAAFGGTTYANFVLSGSGSIGGLSGVTAKIDSYPNGWYRCSITIASVSGGTGGNVAIVANNNNSASVRNPTYTGTGAQVVYIWGAQLELGTFPTSYIPTTTASVVRSADVCSITGSAFSGMWNPLEGTTLVSGDKTNSSNVTGSYFSYQSGATEVGPLMSRTSTSLLGRIRNNSALDLTNLDFLQSPLGEKKLAVAWKATGDSNDRDYCSGGVILTKSNPNTGTAANNQTTLTIGSRPSTSIFNGTISSLRYYKKRLPNTKLQALTV